MKLRLKVGGDIIEIEATRRGGDAVVLLDETEWELTILHRNQERVMLEGVNLATGERKTLRIAGIFQDNQRHLWVNGETIRYERLAEESSVDAGSPQAESSLMANIPSMVTEILTVVGAVVAEGEKLIMLESMKMAMPIQAPYAGIVSAIHCQVGEAVQPGTSLIEINPHLEE